MPKISSSKHRQQLNLRLTAFCAALVGLPVVTSLTGLEPAVLAGVVVFYVVSAYVLHSRLVLGTLAGILFGLISIPPFKGRYLSESIIWQRVGYLGFGVVVGIAVGFLWDRARASHGTSAKKRH